MTILKMAIHQLTGRRCVEVHDDAGKVVACIYPTEDGSNGIHIVSKYFEGEPTRTPESQIPVPTYLLKFRRPYQQ